MNEAFRGSLKPRAVITDGYTLNPGDLDWDLLKQHLTIEIYDHNADVDLEQRAKEAEILIVNKTIIGPVQIAFLPKLKCIFITATGYNNIDLDALIKLNIAVYHAKGYGANSVAQQVFAYILHFTNGVSAHSDSVKKGDWQRSTGFSYALFSMRELNNKVLGIYGYGAIGRRVAEIGAAFGMTVLVHSAYPQNHMEGVAFVTLDEIFSMSDFISINTKLDENNMGIINSSYLSKMKRTAYIINTARALLINEDDLFEYLKGNKIMGAALDVLPEEPPKRHNKLMELDNCLITPHNAWATIESRKRLLDITCKNVQDYLCGEESPNRLV